MIFNEGVDVAELPEIWNQKYEEYLGIRPTNDVEGILQDVHWSGASFGYFPSYALGYMFAARNRCGKCSSVRRLFSNQKLDVRAYPSIWCI